MKKQSKSFSSTLSDCDSDDSQSEEGDHNEHIANNSIVSKANELKGSDPLQLESESDTEEAIEETFQESFNNLQNRLSVVINVNQDLIDRVGNLLRREIF